jgi:hypothetical protein
VRALGTLAFVLLVCACEPRTITLQSPTPTASAGASASGSPTATPVPTPKPTLRPLPIAATVSRLLSYERGGDIGVPSLRLLLLADGRVLTEETNGQLFYRRLTPSGTASLLLQAIQTGYFEKDATYAREPLPGSTPPAHGTTFINFVVQNGGRDVHVSTIPTGQPDDNLYQPSPARDKISALARGFEDLSALLPSSAWAESAPTNYSAQFHRLFVAPQPVPAPQSAPDVETVWPFTPALDVFGEPLTAAIGVTNLRCGIVGFDDAFSLGDALARARAISTYTGGLRVVTASLASRATSGSVRLQMSPLLPNEAPTCVGSQPIF